MARGYQVTIGLIDGQSRPTTITLTLVATINTIAAAQAALDAIVADWPGVSGLGLVNAYLSVPLALTPTTADDASNFDEGAKMKILTTDAKNWSFRIPGPTKDAGGVFTYITGGEVNTADAGIIAFFANYLAAGGYRFGDVAQQTMAVGGILSGTLEKA